MSRCSDGDSGSQSSISAWRGRASSRCSPLRGAPRAPSIASSVRLTTRCRSDSALPCRQARSPQRNRRSCSSSTCWNATSTRSQAVTSCSPTGNGTSCGRSAHDRRPPSWNEARPVDAACLRPEQDGRHRHHGEIVGGALLVAGGHAAALLETIDEPLHLVAFAIEPTVEWAGSALVALVGDGVPDAMLAEPLPDPPAAVASVPPQTLRPMTEGPASFPSDTALLQQRLAHRLVMSLPGAHQQHEWSAMPVRPHMELRGESAAAATQGFARLTPSGPSGALGGTHDGAVDEVHRPIQLSLSICEPLQSSEDALPDTGAPPAIEAVGDGVSRAVLWGQVAPGRSRGQDPRDAIDDPPMWMAGAPDPGSVPRHEAS